jgi:glycerol-3-phosphate acyltransferase PlsY
LLGIGAWVLIVFGTGFVGLATMTAGLVAAVFVGVSGLPEQAGLFLWACATTTLLIYAHRGNIRRMLDGTESRFKSPGARWLRRGQSPK